MWMFVGNYCKIDSTTILFPTWNKGCMYKGEWWSHINEQIHRDQQVACSINFWISPLRFGLSLNSEQGYLRESFKNVPVSALHCFEAPGTGGYFLMDGCSTGLNPGFHAGIKAIIICWAVSLDPECRIVSINNIKSVYFTLLVDIFHMRKVALVCQYDFLSFIHSLLSSYFEFFQRFFCLRQQSL